MAPVSRKPLPATYAPLNQNHPSSFNYAQNDNSNHRPVDFFEVERPRRHIAYPEESEMVEFDSIERLAAHRTVDNHLNVPQPDSNGYDPYGYNHANGYSSQHRYRIFWHWKGEFAALLFAAALVAAMYALLISYNGRPVPDWGYSINLSTLLSLLSTLFRAIIGTVIAQVISQAKWTWYTGTQAQLLQTFQDFDSGSRGTLGSLFLIPKVIRHSLIAALGALVMVASLAVGPFVQQAIKTTSCASPVPGATASLPYANYVPRQAIMLVESGGIVDYSQISAQYIDNAVLASLTGGEDITGSQLSPVCSTGNCTFPIGDPFDNGTFSAESFSTIGLCSSCVDASSLVDFFYENYTETNYNYGLPDGLSLSYGYNNGDYAYGTFASITTDSSLSWLGTLLTPNLAQASRWALVNVTYLAFSSARCGDTATPECPLLTNYSTPTVLDTDKPAGPVAVTCALYPCIRRSLPSVINNKLSEIQLDNKIVWPVSIPAIDLSDNPMVANFEYYAEIQSPCRVNDTVYTIQNMSTAPDSTNLSLHETMLDGTVQVKNVSAPEACIYRHGVVFADVLKGILGAGQGAISVFSNSTCFTTVMYSFGLQCGDGPALGGGTWMYSLFKNGNASVSDIEGFFEGFAVAMTNSYRSTFGSSTFNETAFLQGQLLPPSREVQGIVWQDSLCTSVQWMWLLLPAVIALLTTLLLIWTVAKGWKLRRVEPVWKDNVLPGIIYKDRFKGQDGATLEQVIEEFQGGTERQVGRLLELDEIKKIANNSMVSFHWSAMHEQLRRRK
ncbi:Protein of unknown function (DUF3176) domain containing protein [Hyaloscypha variabilis]